MRRLTDAECRAIVEDPSGDLALLTLELMMRVAEHRNAPVWDRPPLLERLEAER